MGAGASSGIAAAVQASKPDELKALLAALPDAEKTKLRAVLSPSNIVEPTAEGKKMLADKGWDKGCTVFAAPPSEAAVKVLSAMALLKKEHKAIEITFDDKAFEADKMGVKSSDYSGITGGYCRIPAVCIDGVMYVEAVKIVRMLAEQSNAPKEVMDLIILADDNDAKILEAAKHWGWAGLHASTGYGMVNKEHYIDYGKGNKDEAWEKDIVKTVKAFLDKLEATLSKKDKINGYFVGDSLSLADCVFANIPLTLGGIAGIDLEKRYPKLHENGQALVKLMPEGMNGHFEHFPGFVEYVKGANKEARDGGFTIDKLFD